MRMELQHERPSKRIARDAARLWTASGTLRC
jgi:hypothetical protein